MLVEIAKGQTLWEALVELNIVIDRPCAGNGRCGGCAVFVQGVGNVASCRFKEPGQYNVELPDSVKFEAISDIRGKIKLQDFPKNKAAVDIGTTTVVLRAYKEKDVEEFTFVNPQRQYGSDVTSRIKAANEGKLELLQRLIIDKLNSCLSKAYPDGECDELVISANTTMQHIIRGLDCGGLAKAPFRPIDISFCNTNWPGTSNMAATFLPGISAFVGADIVSGLYQIKILDNARPQLFIDLGTNGEIALADEKGIVVASTAAGPAFEGSPLAFRVHAAGVIKALSYMFKNKIIDEYGTLTDEFFESGYLVTADICGNKELVEPVVFTQDDIRAIQMAKAAIRAGIQILLAEKKLSVEALDQVYIAGGMGYYIDISDAIAIGLLPEGISNIKAVGNTSLVGAADYLTQPAEARNYMERIVSASREIVLSNHPDFETLYIDNMNFNV